MSDGVNRTTTDAQAAAKLRKLFARCHVVPAGPGNVVCTTDHTRVDMPTTCLAVYILAGARYARSGMGVEEAVVAFLALKEGAPFAALFDAVHREPTRE
jgi:hypothetical protein